MSNKEILKGIADNEALFTAVRDLVLSYFSEIPYAEGASDELLGQITRARYVGRQKVESAFREIEQYKTAPKTVDKDNPAF